MWAKIKTVKKLEALIKWQIIGDNLLVEVYTVG